MRKSIYIFATLSIAIFFLFQLSKYSLTQFVNHPLDLYIFLMGLAFISIGFYINRILSVRQTGNSKKYVKHSMLSKQEYKILCLMNEGLSNHEIAENLFIAESTVKKHVSNILNKLHAKRRTEALKIGRELQII